MKTVRPVPVLVATAIFMLLFSGCSINQYVLNTLADTLSATTEGEDSVFLTDEDPQLVGDALPFALKLYETVLQQTPDHEELLLATGSAFISYANAFVATPAAMLSYDQWELRESEQRRAKLLYLRGRDYVIHGLDVRYPGFADSLSGTDSGFLDTMDRDDVPFLYWIGAGWVGAFSLDIFDMDLAFTVSTAGRLMERALVLDESYSDGALHDFLVQFHAAVPETMGGDPSRVDFHHQRALELAAGRLAGPYISYAEAMYIPQQDVEQFVSYMKRALEVDPDGYPAARLMNVLSQRKAAWYLENLDEFFLLEGDEAF